MVEAWGISGTQRRVAERAINPASTLAQPAVVTFAEQFMSLAQLRQRPDRVMGLMLFFILLSCYLYFFPRWADWNQNSRLDLVFALVNDHTVHIDKYVSNTGDYAYFDGHYFSDKAPGTALLGAPVYATFRAVTSTFSTDWLRSASTSGKVAATTRLDGSASDTNSLFEFAALSMITAIVVALPAAVLGVIFYGIARAFGCSSRSAWVATLLYALATSAFPYANAFVGHQTAACLLFSAFALVYLIRRQRLAQSWLLLVGLLLSAAVVTEYPAALIGGLVGLYALKHGRIVGALFRLALGALPPLIALAVMDYAAFGTGLPVGYAHSALWADVHQQGFISLTYPKLDALLGLTFGAHRGLFFLSPFLLLAAPGYVIVWRDRWHRAEFWVLACAPLAFLLFNASSAMWQGGFAVGPRYLVPSLPFLALVAGIGLARSWQSPRLRPVVALVVAWSITAVWCETIAGQAFPDYTANPLFDLSLPRLMRADIARNVGMLLGLGGWASLAPLSIVVLAVLSPFCGAIVGPARRRRPAGPTSVSLAQSAAR